MNQERIEAKLSKLDHLIKEHNVNKTVLLADLLTKVRSIFAVPENGSRERFVLDDQEKALRCKNIWTIPRHPLSTEHDLFLNYLGIWVSEEVSNAQSAEDLDVMYAALDSKVEQLTTRR